MPLLALLAPAPVVRPEALDQSVWLSQFRTAFEEEGCRPSESREKAARALRRILVRLPNSGVTFRVPSVEWIEALQMELARDGRQPELAEQAARRMLKRILGRVAGWPQSAYVRSDGDEVEEAPAATSSWLWGRGGRPGR